MLKDIMRHGRSVAIAASRTNMFFHPPGHFYSPILHPSDRLRIIAATDYNPAGVAGVDLRESEQLALLQEFVHYYEQLPFKAEPTDGLRYHYENPSYSYSDAIMYACMLRQFRPRRIIEVGSGNSSALALDVNDRFLEGRTEISFIEPFPKNLQSVVKPQDLRSRLQARPVQEIPFEFFQRLEANDILFIDSTHVARPGSDVNYLLLEVLPRLNPGVLIHFHDVFYPFQYPGDWIMEGRAWNEDYLLRAFLMFNDSFEVVLFNTFLEVRHRAWFEENMPLCLENPGGSIWIRRIS